jgi:hypothetical protein
MRSIHLTAAVRALQSMVHLDRVILKIRMGKYASRRLDLSDHRIRYGALNIYRTRTMLRSIKVYLVERIGAFRSDRGKSARKIRPPYNFPFA